MSTSAPQQEVSIWDFTAIFRRHRVRFVVWFVLVMAAVFTFLVVSPRRYQSESQLLLRLGRENVVLDATSTLGAAPVIAVPQSREYEINSVVAVLHGRSLAEKVTDAIGPENMLNADEKGTANSASQDAQPSNVYQSVLDELNPYVKLDIRDRAIRAFANNLAIEPIRDSNVLRIAYRSHDPKLSRDVIAQLVELYLTEHMRIYRPVGGDRFLTEQAQKTNDQLIAAEAHLRDLRKETGLVATDQQRTALIALISEMEGELLRAEQVAVSTKVESDHLRAALEGLSQMEVTSFTTGKAGSATDALRERLYELELEEQNLLATYADDHFEVRQIRQQIDAGKRMLAEQEELNGDEPHTEVTRGPSQAFVEAKVELIQKEPLISAMGAKQEILRKQLIDAREDLNQLNENDGKLAQVQREVEILAETYRRYMASSEQARIDSSMEAERISNISVIQPATLDLAPVFPNVTLTMLVGLVLALCVSSGMVLLAESRQRATRPTVLSGAARQTGTNRNNTAAAVPAQKMGDDRGAARHEKEVSVTA